MRSVPAHQDRVAALFAPAPSEHRASAEALGLVVAADIAAPIGLPGFDNSAMDGFAVRAAEVAGAGPDTPVRLPVSADIPAGRTDRVTLEPGTAQRIMTGAPMPEGADAVIPVESTDADNAAHTPESVTIFASVSTGKHIRTADSDVAAGTTVLSAGTRIGAPQLGLLAALGITEVPVYQPVEVVVLSTGSELIEPGKPLRHGQIYESNGPMLAAAAREAGASATHLHFVADDVAAFGHRLDEAATSAQLIITSGGVSAGAFEVVKDALAATGEVEFVKVAMQPGMPQGCGYHRAPDGHRVPIITLPGNPVSSLVSFEVFIRPPLRAAMGLPPHRPRTRARLSADIRSPRGKRQFLRGKLDGDLIEPIGPPASHHLRYLAHANALIDVPAEVDAVAAGTQVDVIVL